MLLNWLSREKHKHRSLWHWKSPDSRKAVSSERTALAVLFLERMIFEYAILFYLDQQVKDCSTRDRIRSKAYKLRTYATKTD